MTMKLPEPKGKSTPPPPQDSLQLEGVVMSESFPVSACVHGEIRPMVVLDDTLITSGFRGGGAQGAPPLLKFQRARAVILNLFR